MTKIIEDIKSYLNNDGLDAYQRDLCDAAIHFIECAERAVDANERVYHLGRAHRALDRARS